MNSFEVTVAGGNPDAGTPRGAGVVLKGRRTDCETTCEVLIFARAARVDWLVGGAGILWLDVTGAWRSWNECVERFDMLGRGWIEIERRGPN